MKILLVDTRSMSDAVRNLPIIDTILEQHPEATIDLLATFNTINFLEKDPRFRHCHYLFRTVSGNINFGLMKKRLSAHKYHVIINFSRSLTMQRLLYGLKSSIRYGFYIHPLSSIYCTQTTCGKKQRYQHELMLSYDCIRGFVTAPLKKTSTVFLNDETVQRCKSQLIDFNKQKKKIIVWHLKPQTKANIQKNSIQQMMKSLLLSGAYHIVLTGKTIENEFYSEEHEDMTNLIGKTTVEELLSIISLSDCIVGEPCGVLQLSSFLNIPMIILTAGSHWSPLKHGYYTPYQKINSLNSMGNRNANNRSLNIAAQVSELINRKVNKEVPSESEIVNYLIKTSIHVFYMGEVKKKVWKEQSLAVTQIGFETFSLLRFIKFIVKCNGYAYPVIHTTKYQMLFAFLARCLLKVGHVVKMPFSFVISENQWLDFYTKINQKHWIQTY